MATWTTLLILEQIRDPSEMKYHCSRGASPCRCIYQSFVFSGTSNIYLKVLYTLTYHDKNDYNDEDDYDNGPQFVQANIEENIFLGSVHVFFLFDLEATDLYKHDMKYTNTVKKHTWEQVCQKFVKSDKAKAVQ